MLPQQEIKFSEYVSLYDRIIPKDHPLRKIEAMVDWDEIYVELAPKYSEERGRMAEDPIRMFKYLLLKAWTKLSDVDLVERCRYDMSYKWFLGLMPEDDVIDASTLCRFRKKRMEDLDLLKMLIRQSVSIAQVKGMVRTGTIIVDSTHSRSRAIRHTASEMLRSSMRLLRESVLASYPNADLSLPENDNREDTLAEIGRASLLISKVMTDPAITVITSAMQERINYLQELTDDIKESCKSEVDRDARVGHKSAEEDFFGYKTHIAMTPERIIVAATVTPGQAGDGPELQNLVKQSRDAGVEVGTIVGDAAYSSLDNLKMAQGDPETEEGRMLLVAKLNPIISGGNRQGDDGFVYNKDADMYVCPEGHLPQRKEIERRHGKNDRIKYIYRETDCSTCPIRDTCLSAGAKKRHYSVRIVADEYKKHIEFENTSEFRRLSRERYKIEAKNAELKNALGYGRALSYGLGSMRLQAATTIFVANLRRIMRMEAE